MPPPVDVSYAAVLSCNRTEPLPTMGIETAALGLMKRHRAEAAEIERLTTSWVGSLTPDCRERWGRTTSPSTEPDTTTYWQILRWEAAGGPPRYWTRDSYSAAVAVAREVAQKPGGREVMVTRVVCERVGVILANGHVYGPALRRLLAPEAQRETPGASGREVA